jgi:PIN domain nuclease of toxin-antitoxin system
LTEVVVLDASAVIAVLDREPGQEIVRPALRGALLSAVNLAEVITKLCERGVAAERAREITEDLGVEVVWFDEDLAIATGALRMATRPAGLSLGDRACLALARARNGVAFTAEHRWRSVAAAAGVTIRNIRPLS